MGESNDKYIVKAQEFIKRWLLGTICFHHNNTIFWQEDKYWDELEDIIEGCNG